MATPCRKCGANKTEPVRRGVFYSLAKALGRRPRRCARCHRLRMLRMDEPTDSPVPPRPGVLRRLFARDPDPPEAQDPVACPHCGGKDYRHSRRRWHERVAGRPRMVRCRRCRKRFPLPEGVGQAR